MIDVRNNSIILVCLVSYFLNFGQSGINVQYKVGVYGFDESKLTNDLIKSSNTHMNTFLYELISDNKISIFKMVDDIQNDQTLSYKMAKTLAYGNDLYYKNIIKNEKIKQINNDGDDLINIIIPIDKYKWEITKETKIISGYKCVKAICHINFFSKLRNKHLSFDPVVWFTAEVPYPNGPIGLDGLPGLVLEATFNGKLYFYATHIQTNIKINSKDLLLKKTNKSYSEEEYEDIVASKSRIPRN